MKEERISNCCDAPPTTEYDADNLGHCSECGEGAVFYSEHGSNKSTELGKDVM